MVQTATRDSASVAPVNATREWSAPTTADRIAARILGLTFGPGSVLRYYQDQAGARAAANEADADAGASPDREAVAVQPGDGKDADFSAQFIAWVLGEGYAAGRVRRMTPGH